MKDTLVFISTFASPHTLPFGVEAAKFYSEVVFINTMPLTEERLRMGYDISSDSVEIINLSDSEQRCRELILSARDVILSGTRFDLVSERIEAGGSVYIAHERLFKKGVLKLLDPRTWKISAFCRRVRNKNVFLLSIGDFAARDFVRLGFNKDKVYRFGYFPKSSVAPAPERVPSGVTKILWVGRMVGFKRPKMALKAARLLPEDFELTMAGDGALWNGVKAYARRKNIAATLLGNTPNDKVIELMRESDILLSTSDRGEGWGAVINEGMSAGCAVVCSDTIGCAGTLADGKNSVIFATHSVKDLKRAIIEARDRREELGLLGRLTVEKEFNARVAAERFAALAGVIDKNIFKDGICSKVF